MAAFEGYLGVKPSNQMHEKLVWKENVANSLSMICLHWQMMQIQIDDGGGGRACTMHQN